MAELSEILAARSRLQWTATALVAAVVTMLVALPMAARALDARDDDRNAAATDGIEHGPLDGPTVALDGAVVTGPTVITVTVPDTGAVAFRLRDANGDDVLTGADTVGPDFSVVNDESGEPAEWASTEVGDGTYTLLVTVTVVDAGGSTDLTRRMATFEVRTE